MPTPPAHCSFCDLIRGAAEVSVCYEDGAALAFMDIQPVNAGHVLVVPREHYESLVDLPRDLGMHLFDVAMRLGDKAVAKIHSFARAADLSLFSAAAQIVDTEPAMGAKLLGALLGHGRVRMLVRGPGSTGLRCWQP